MISRSWIVAHSVSCASFAGLAGRWITRGSLWRVSWSAGRILSVSWERVDGGQADEGVPGQHEAVERCGLQWGEWSTFLLLLSVYFKWSLIRQWPRVEIHEDEIQMGKGVLHCRRGGLCCWAFRVEYRNGIHGMGFKRWARKQGVKEFSSVTGIWRVFTKDRRWEEEAREDPLLKPDDDDWLWSSSTINLPVVSHSQHQWDRPARVDGFFCGRAEEG